MSKQNSLLDDEYNILEGRYGWRRSSNKYELCFWKLYYCITGLLVTLLIFLPFLIFEAIIFGVIYSIYILTNFNIQYSPHKILGDLMLFFISTPNEKRGIFWKIGHTTISFIRMVFAKINAADFSLFTSGNRIGRDLYPNTIKTSKCPMAFPWTQGIMVTSSNFMKEFYYRKNQIRGGAMFGYEDSANPDADLLLYGHGHAIDSANPRWQIQREVNLIALTVEDFDVSNLDSFTLPPKEFMKRYFKNVDTMVKSALQIHFGLIIYYLFGVQLTYSELEYIGKYGTLAAVSTTTPEWIHFLIGNNYLRGIWNDVIFFWKNLIQFDERFTCTKKYKQLKDYMLKANVNEDMVFILIAQALIFAGGRGALKSVIRRYKNTPILDKKLFKQNPVNYIYEINTNPTQVTAVFQKQIEDNKKYLIGDKEYTFPKNTLIGGGIAWYHDQEFKDKSFNINKDYSNSLIWSGLEKDILSKDYKKRPPRYCPAHDLCFLFLYAYIYKLHNIH